MLIPMLRYLMLDWSCPDTLVRIVQEVVESLSNDALIERIVDLQDKSFDLPVLHKPVLHLRGRGDRLVGNWGPRSVRRLCPNMRMVTIAGPHLFAQRRPEECARLIQDFANRSKSEEQ
jgi:pimeloyl-ACP methyl ester carboxylesterase